MLAAHLFYQFRAKAKITCCASPRSTDLQQLENVADLQRRPKNAQGADCGTFQRAEQNLSESNWF